MSNQVKFILFSVALLIAILLAYSNHWNNGFHFDDSHTIQNNVYIQRIGNIPLFFKDVSTFSSLPRNASYRPIVSTTLAIDYYLGKGLNPFYFHLSTFIFFLLQGVLMYFFFIKILNTVSKDTPNSFISLFAVGFYTLHPTGAETINYIIARSDSISTLFVVTGFVVYQYSAFARKTFLYLLPILIGGLAKPTTIMFAPMLVVYHILFEQESDFLSFVKWEWKKLLLITIPSFAIAIGLYLFIKKQETSWNPGGYSLFRYVITQPYVFLHYASQFLLPTQLSADTDLSPFEGLTDIRAIIGFVFFACMVFAIFYLSQFKKWRPVSFGLAFFLLALVPTTIVPLAEVMNDHRVFFPFVGLVLAFVWAMYLLLEKYLKQASVAVLTGVLVLILCGYAYGTHTRNKVWYTEETLWHDVSIKSPKNGRGLMNYGLVFMGRGSMDTANYYFTKALEYCPNYSILHVNTAILKNSMGDKQAADEYFRKAMVLGSDESGNYFFYARFLKENGRYTEAIHNLYQCIRLVDARMDARYMLMPLLYEQKRFEELRNVAARTLQLAPGDATATNYMQIANTGKSLLQIEEENSVNYKTADQFLNLSLMYYNAANYRGCINAAQKALAINPKYAEAYNNIGTSYNQLKQFDSAVIFCEKAVQLKPDFQLAKNNLNWAKSQLQR
jgi:tetratricopeptide (TPR) repeat protein